MASLERIFLSFILSLLHCGRLLEAKIAATSSRLAIPEAATKASRTVTSSVGFQTGIIVPITKKRPKSSTTTTRMPNSFNTSDVAAAPRGTIAIALTVTIAMPPTDIPSAISTPSSSGTAHGLNTAGVIAIVSVLTTIALSAIALWQGGQGIRYPRREHQETMKMLVARRKTAEELLRAAEEGSAPKEMADDK
ncbi:hypothetical protein FRB94_007308 [Tulasnella sp. JGI-2019a]|nr:hypothetical protein FRB94_007308 [Tulasnella sp. JGI-2019a]